MARMSFRMQRLHAPSAKLEPVFVARDDNARLVNRHDVPVHRARALFAVDADGPGNQPLRVHHVRGTARMHDAARVGQVLHEQARTTGVVEVNVRQEYVVDVGAYWQQMQNVMDWEDVSEGITKSVVFGIVASLVAVWEGYKSTPTAEGVGRATTRTVVVTSIAVLFFNYMITAMYI